MEAAESRIRLEHERLKELERRIDAGVMPHVAPPQQPGSAALGPQPSATSREQSMAMRRQQSMALSRQQSMQSMAMGRDQSPSGLGGSMTFYDEEVDEETRFHRALGSEALLDKGSYAHLLSDTIQREPIEDVPGIVDLFSKSGGVVPLAVHVAEVEAMQQAATRLQVMSQKCDEQMAQLDQREKNAEEILLAEEGTKVLQYTVQDMRALSTSIQKRKAEIDTTVTTLLTRFENAADKGIELFVPMLLKTVEKYNYTFGERGVPPLSRTVLPPCCVRSFRMPRPTELARRREPGCA